MRELRRRTASALVVLLASLALAACAGGDETLDPTTLVDDDSRLVRPTTVHVDPGADPEHAADLVRTAQRLYTFWDTGEASYLEAAVTDDFRDRTLPPGRVQGPDGPVQASEGFRTAVPDLECELVDLYLTQDTFTARLVFHGHFSGTYEGRQGDGRAIRFDAIDIQRADGPGTTITEDWHLEDNLGFLTQAGLLE